MLKRIFMPNRILVWIVFITKGKKNCLPMRMTL